MNIYSESVGVGVSTDYSRYNHTREKHILVISIHSPVPIQMSIIPQLAYASNISKLCL